MSRQHFPLAEITAQSFHHLATDSALFPLQAAVHCAVEVGATSDERVVRAVALIVRSERVREVRCYLFKFGTPSALLDRLVTVEAFEAVHGMSAIIDEALTVATSAALPPDARRKVEKASASLRAQRWDEGANLFDEARDETKELLDDAAADVAAAVAALDVLYALALASDPESRDHGEAWDVIKEYVAKLVAFSCPIEPLLLLVLARLEHGGVGHTVSAARPRSPAGLACLALYAHKMGMAHVSGVPQEGGGASSGLLSETELFELSDDSRNREAEVVAASRQETELIAPSRQGTSSLRPEDRWKSAKEEDADAQPPTSALDELMKLRGLQHVKNIALELHTRVMAEKRLPEAMRVKTSLNCNRRSN